jgi:hypothetical protein
LGFSNRLGGGGSNVWAVIAGRQFFTNSGAPVTVAECLQFEGISGRFAQAFNVEQTTNNGLELPSTSR